MLGLTCAVEEALLDGANPVPDSYFTASSDFSSTLKAPAARMSVSYCWIPLQVEIDANPPTSYLQVSTRILNRTTIQMLTLRTVSIFMFIPDVILILVNFSAY